MRQPLILAGMLVAVPAFAQTIQSYDAVCPSTCTASDGTPHPAGTVLSRFAWDGVSPYAAHDSAGLTLTPVLDAAQSVALYQPPLSTALTPTFQTSQAALSSFGFSGGQLTQTKVDGTTMTGSTGAGISGSVTHAGRTMGGVSIAFSTIALGGTPTTTAAVDSKSGPAQPGDACQVASATTSALPSNVLFSCAILSAGVATITAYPLAGVAIVSPTYSVNVFWRG